MIGDDVTKFVHLYQSGKVSVHAALSSLGVKIAGYMVIDTHRLSEDIRTQIERMVKNSLEVGTASIIALRVKTITEKILDAALDCLRKVQAPESTKVD